MKNIVHILLLNLCFTCLMANTPSMIINVDAGEDMTICFGETLNLSDLEASISGDVDDGIWFSQGDGIFLPGAESNGIFSTTNQYQPGPNDLSNGSFGLILVSDDPDGNGPMVEVSDNVTISFMNAPALVCNNSINVSLAEACQQEVDIFMLLANPTAPISKYSIQVFDENDQLIPDNILTLEHIGDDISFEVSHDCTSSFCQGSITVSDYIAPFLNCLDITANCEVSASPDSVGLPIPFYSSATLIENNTYEVSDFDACGLVTLTYNDIEEEVNCAGSPYAMIVSRSWVAIDESGNSSSCSQQIFLNPLTLADVVMPSNYDGIANPPLSCDGDWLMLDNGYPAPEETGSPAFPSCSNLAPTYTDAYFEECGAGFKIVRQWFVIDWCTSLSEDHNQIIKILDTEGPEFECPEDFTISSEAYDCVGKSVELDFVMDVVDCSDYVSSFGLIDSVGTDVTALYVNGNVLSEMPVGEYQLVYIATDVCGNQSECLTGVTVVDDSSPFAVCDGYTQVSVGSNGIADLLAMSLDDESYDNCGELTMEIAKMTDECGWGLNFGSKAHFCCEEIGDTVMVAFRVTDEVGLMNTCMVSVFVEDKLPPIIECPSDLTISCSVPVDLSDLSDFGAVEEGSSSSGSIIIDGVIQGQSGYFYDNCGATVEEVISSDLECGIGTISRTFTATDYYGQTASCTQTISVFNDNPFLESDIIWPNNFEMIGCDTLQANPSTTGEPTLSTEKCAQVAATYEDQYFFISGGACVKVLREWTVIDWCQFEVNEDAGLWTYIQEIKLKNNIAPTFISCEDQEICSYDEACQSEEVTITAFANDDCTDSLNLLYLWKLDIDDNGTIDEEGEGISLTRELNLGMHRVFWTVEDGCGNATNCNYGLDVRDCKKPTPYCTSSITTTIMPSTGEIDIWASDFDYGSTDNCTESSDLIFSFSQDLNDVRRVINCDSIVNGVSQLFNMEMWVTDEWGNQERCFVSFIVQDNADGCEDNGTIKGKISGKVATEENVTYPDIEIDIKASIDSYSDFKMTSADGRFSLDTTPEFLKYTLRPYYNSAPQEGVSTLDLVKIQQHILGTNRFDNPYDIIAGDVSHNQKLTSSDLLVMRKMILGVIVEWPKEGPNWTFVDSSYVFEDVEDPYDYPDSIVIDFLMDTTKAANFVAIKIGDVNGSYQPFAINNVNDTRSNKSILATFEKERKGDRISNDLIFETDQILDGLQMSFQIPKGATVLSSYLNENDYVIQDDMLKISWLNLAEQSLEGVSFLTISYDGVKEDVKLTADLNPEVYINLETFQLDIENQIQTSINDLRAVEVSALGNPFANDLALQIHGDFGSCSLQIFDAYGKVVFEDKNLRNNLIRIPSDRFNAKGIYFVKYSINIDSQKSSSSQDSSQDGMLKVVKI